MGSAGIILLNKYDSDKKQWLVIHKVIKTDSFQNLKYGRLGVISTFSIEVGDEIIRTFKPYIAEGENGRFVYYIDSGHYREYKLGEREVKDVERFDNFEYGIEGDTLKIFKRILSLRPEPASLNYRAFEWLITDVEEELVKENGEIIIPPDAIEGELQSNFLNEYGSSFFQSFSNQLRLGEITTGTYSEDQMHDLIASISIVISKIDDDIIQVFVADNPLVETEWITDTEIMVNEHRAIYLSTPHNKILLTTKSHFLAYYSKLQMYYNGVLNNLYVIDHEQDIGKFANFLLSMHPTVMTRINVEDKLDLLDYIVNYKLQTGSEEFLTWTLETASAIRGPVPLKISDTVEAYENLVVSICQSFNGDHLLQHSLGVRGEKITHVDIFLTGLLKIAKAENITMYESLYNRMSTSFNITRDLMSLSNWIFETEFEPADTRAGFVQSIYWLWSLSKYDPYDSEGNLKPYVIGSKILNDSYVTFEFESDRIDHDNLNAGHLYYYTKETCMDATPTVINDAYGDPMITYNQYYNRRTNAAPIVLPYKSEKTLGIFKDNFKFEFDGQYIKAFQDLPYDHTTYIRGTDDLRASYYSKYHLYGKYELYQPVSLLNYNVETKVPLLTTTGNEFEINGTTINTMIPAFVLQYIDQMGDNSDYETLLGYLVDGVLTFSGIGNLSKLRHLRWLGVGGNIGLFTRNGMRITLGAVEFSSGVLSFFGNFIECGEDATFCKHFKEFITLFEIASGTISLGDSLVTLALKKKAGKVIELAGGGINDTIIVNNLRSKLEDLSVPHTTPDDILDTAEAIKDLGKIKFGDILVDLVKQIDEIYEKIQPKLLKRIKKSSIFSTKHFNNFFNEANIKTIIEDCIKRGIYNEKHMHDIILMSCRGVKKINFVETRTIINYYTRVVRLRGFPTGFHSLDDYKLFSEKVKTFLDEYCRKWGINNARYEIQGSAQFKSHPLDPNVGDVPVFQKDGTIIQPDDLDGRIYMSRHQANKFLKELKRAWRDHFRNEFPDLKSAALEEKVIDKMKPIYKKAEDGMIYKGSMPPPPEKTFANQLRDAVKRDDGTDIFYPLSSKLKDPITNESIPDVGFSIIIKNSDYDIDPVSSLKF